jgi:hypothetical protein
LYRVGTANASVVPVASDSTGSSEVTTSIRQGSRRENPAWSVALTPYARSPVSHQSTTAPYTVDEDGDQRHQESGQPSWSASPKASEP